MTKLKVFSTFTGIGGFELGLIEALGEENLEFIGYSEIDKYAIQVYNYHFPNHTNYGNITTINTGTIPDFNILVGGSPCFKEGTLILTSDGLKEIQEVKVGDSVFTHKNRWKKVVKTFITENTRLRRIKATGILETYTTNELNMPTVKTSKNHTLKPEKTKVLFSVQPFGDANTTGTPTTSPKETKINANKAS